MNSNRIKLAAFIAVSMFFSTANAQRAEVTVILNEAFFDAILDAAFQNFDPIEFQIGAAGDGSKTEAPDSASFIQTSHFVRGAECREVVRLLREKDSVKTAVRCERERSAYRSRFLEITIRRLSDAYHFPARPRRR